MGKDQDDRYDYLNYIDQLNPEQQELVKEFYKEYYFDDISRKKKEGLQPIITDPDIEAEARRNHNSMKTDALFRGKKDGTLNMASDNTIDFMEDVSDELEWEDVFKIFGYEEAVKSIVAQTINNLENSKLSKENILLRYYEKRDRLRRMLNREKRK